MSHLNYNLLEVKLSKLVFKFPELRVMYNSLGLYRFLSSDISNIIKKITSILYFDGIAIDLDYVKDKCSSLGIESIRFSLLYEDIKNTEVDNSEFWHIVDAIKLDSIKSKIIPSLITEYDKILKSSSEFDVLGPLSRVQDTISTALGKNQINVKTEAELRDIRSRLEIYSGKKEADQKRFFTGYKQMDDILYGFASSELIIFMGATGMGKTTLLLNLGYQLWEFGKANVMFFSLEMPTIQVLRRLDSRILGIPYDTLKKMTVERDVEEVIKKLETSTRMFKVIDIPPKSPVAKLEEYILTASVKPDIIIVDYLGLVGADYGRKDSDRWEVLDDVSLSLKYLAKRYHINVITAAQITSDAMKKKTVASDGLQVYDIAGSRGVPANADGLIGIHVDDDLNIMYFNNAKARDTAKAQWQMYIKRELCHIYEINKT